MARTKQTARKALVGTAPRFHFGGKGKVGCKRVSSYPRAAGSGPGHVSES